MKLQKVVLLDVLEVFIGAVLQLVGGIFVTDDDGMGMLLQATDGPHVVDWLFNTMTKGTGLIMAIDHDHDLFGIHHCTNTNGEGQTEEVVDSHTFK